MENTNESIRDIKLLNVSSSPHVRTKDTVQRIMLDVIIAMVPAMVVSFIYFGLQALSVIIVSVVSCVLAEAVSQKLLKKRITVYDLSAAVTGILLAFNLPAGFPLWKAAIGGIFAIVVVKQMFGGLGSNFMNPALAGRAFLLASWGKDLSSTPLPFKPDTLSGPTPLAILKAGNGAGQNSPALWDLFIGNIPGMLGEVSAAALLIGGAYLILRGVIHIRIPASMIGSFSIFILIFGMIKGDMALELLPNHILSGGLILGAFFMATDYATTPMTNRGQIVFGIGAGFLTALIRAYGGYPEGVSYAILIMNVCTPLIDKYIVEKPFGLVKEACK